MWAMLDLLATNKYIPSVVVIHIRASDFGTLPNHLVGHTATQMLNTIKHMLRNAQPFPHMHLGVFVSHMLPRQWYPGWELQQQARRSRSGLNRALAKAVAGTGCFVIPHPELSPQDYPAFLSTGSQILSTLGNLIFLAEIQAAVCKWDPQFTLPRQFQPLQEQLPNIQGDAWSNILSRHSSCHQAGFRHIRTLLQSTCFTCIILYFSLLTFIVFAFRQLIFFSFQPVKSFTCQCFHCWASRYLRPAGFWPGLNLHNVVKQIII